MRHKSTFGFLLAAILVVMAPLGAQAQDQKVHFSFGGGWTAPNSEVSDRLGQGYNFNFGLDVNVNPVVSIEGLYSFNGLGEKAIPFPVAPCEGCSTVPTNFYGSMNMQYGTVSAILTKPAGQVRPYGLVGMGVYYRPVKVTTPSVGFAPGYCDPWFYICYPGGWVPVDRIIGERSSTDFGMTFGGGVKFGPVYAELRYHYIWGPTIEGQNLSATPFAGTSSAASLVGQKANGQFLATTFGVRF